MRCYQCEPSHCLLSYPSPKQAALQVDYIPYLDFIAKQVSPLHLCITLWNHTYIPYCTMYKIHNHVRFTIADRSSAKPTDITSERSCALGPGGFWPLHSISVPSQWAWAMGWGPTHYPYSVGAGCSAIQNQSHRRTRDQGLSPFFPMAADIWRECDHCCASV